MIVYFRDKNNNYLKLGEAENQTQVNNFISKHLENHNYRAPYWRWWMESNGDLWCDVGSWSEFYVVKGVDEHFLERE